MIGINNTWLSSDIFQSHWVIPILYTYSEPFSDHIIFPIPAKIDRNILFQSKKVIFQSTKFRSYDRNMTFIPIIWLENLFYSNHESGLTLTQSWSENLSFSNHLIGKRYFNPITFILIQSQDWIKIGLTLTQSRSENLPFSNHLIGKFILLQSRDWINFNPITIGKSSILLQSRDWSNLNPITIGKSYLFQSFDWKIYFTPITRAD